MPSLLRRILSGHNAKGPAREPEDGVGEKFALEELPLNDEGSDESRRGPASEKEAVGAVTLLDLHQAATGERGLIPADQLPSAAAALAELFPSEPANDPFSGEAIDNEIAERTPEDVASIKLMDAAPAAGRESAGEEQPEHATAASPLETFAAIREIDKRATGSEENAGTGMQSEAVAAARRATEAYQAATPGDVAIQDASAATASQSASPIAQPPAADRYLKTFDKTEKGAAPAPTREVEDAEIVKAASMAQLESPAASGRDWKLEEKLASHLEWLDSRGNAGSRADLSDANLEGQELIGVKLTFADLHDANLRAADLLLADLRDANLMRADLEDSCLVGANLEAANLEGASLETAMGLVPRQIAGANLRDALLPPQIMEFEAAMKFARASRIAWRCFAPLMPVVLLSWLIVWKVKDAQLLTDSAVIPYLHSRTAAAAMPTAQIFLLAPLVIFSVYLIFHFQLQKVWEAVLELPAIFPDGHPLDDHGPGLIIGLLRAHFWWIGRDGSSTMWVEKTVSVLTAYWIAPFTLVLFWARYLTMQEAKGTLLQALLATIAMGVALRATLNNGRAPESWATKRRWTARLVAPFRRISPSVTASVFGLVLLLLSVGTLVGVPHERSRAPQYSPASIRRWAPDVLWAFGFDPYAQLTEATLSRKPKGWTGADSQVAAVSGPQLNDTKFRYALGYGVFLANAHLWQSDFEGAYLSEADLRGADLGNSDLRRAVLDGAMLTGANLNRALLGGAVLARADLRWTNLSYASLENATLVDSRLDGATLYDAQMISASLARASLEKADLRGALLNSADLDHADLQQALLWSAKLPGANLYGAKLQGAVAIDADLRGTDLREAQFAGTVLSDANLTGAMLDGADLRGALELRPSQICASKSRQGVLLDATLAMEVTAECGALQ